MESPQNQAIVIIDDEKSFTDLLGHLLGEHLTSPIHTFTHPAQALASIPTLRAGIIVTDYYMPGMNGLDLIRKAHALSPQTPCILITGHPFTLDDHGSEGLQNLKAVLPKPFRWRQLVDMIQQHWKGPNPPAYREPVNLD